MKKQEIKKMVENLAVGESVLLVDDSEYREGQSSTGGCYQFSERYIMLSNGKFEVHYSTSADFDYCRVCGNFRAHEDCIEFETMTTEKVVDYLYRMISDNEECSICKQVYAVDPLSSVGLYRWFTVK